MRALAYAVSMFKFTDFKLCGKCGGALDGAYVDLGVFGMLANCECPTENAEPMDAPDYATECDIDRAESEDITYREFGGLS